jgi:hypothetical protein
MSNVIRFRPTCYACIARNDQGFMAVLTLLMVLRRPNQSVGQMVEDLCSEHRGYLLRAERAWEEADR